MTAEPTTGTPARHQTVVRVLYDDIYLYVAGYMHDADGAGGVRSGLMRRDFDTPSSDVFTIMLDPFG